MQRVSNALENDIRKKCKKEQRGDDDVDNDGGGSGDDAQEFTLNYIGASRFAFHSLVVDT